MYSLSLQITNGIKQEPKPALIPHPSNSRSKTPISILDIGVMHGDIAPDTFLYSPLLGAFYIRRYIGIKRHNRIRIEALQSDGKEVELDVPIRWVHLSWKWTWHWWKCRWTNQGFVGEWRPPIKEDQLGAESAVNPNSLPMITITFHGSDFTNEEELEDAKWR